jgi:signal peptidase II
VLIYLFRSARTDDRVLGACALLLAGIAGNLTDRARFGFVIDFILLHYKSYHWPVFNVADMSICAGAFLLIFDIFKSRSQNSGVRSQEKIGGQVAGTQKTE